MTLLKLKLNSKTIYITHIKNSSKHNDYNMLQEAINEVSEIIHKRKEKYYNQN